MLVNLEANLITLGLHVTKQEVPQKLLHLGNSLTVSLPNFFEHLLDVNKLKLAGILFLLGAQTHGPTGLLKILSGPSQHVNCLG